MNEPKCLIRMKLCECWGDNLNVEELKQVNVYIEQLQQNKVKFINYLEDKIKETKEAKEFTDKVIQESSAYESGLIDAYEDILERLKSGKYE